MPTIRTSIEAARGCGHRKPGGKYLVADGPAEGCALLPIEMHRCPTCSAGVKPARGWTWIDGDKIVDPRPHGERHHRFACPLAHPIGRAGLLWIGGRFYPTPEDWTAEALSMGVSRRITQVPKGLEVGKTLVLIAHRECLIGGERRPAIFHAFVPTAIEYVVKGTETTEELERLEKRGFSLVDVKHAPETNGALPLSAPA